MGRREEGKLTGAIQAAHTAVSRLGIADPDPDAYDRGYNEAIRRACDVIQSVGLNLNAEREQREAIRRAKREESHRLWRQRREAAHRRHTRYRTLEDINIDDG